MVPLTKHAIVSQLTFFLWCVGTFCWKGLVNHQEHLLEGHLTLWAAGCFFLSAVVEFWILFCFNPLILKQNSKAENHKKPQQLHFFFPSPSASSICEYRSKQSLFHIRTLFPCLCLLVSSFRPASVFPTHWTSL